MLRLIIWVLCVAAVPGQVQAQGPVTHDRVEVVAGTTAEYPFYSGSVVYVPQISQPPQHGSAILVGGSHPNLGVPGNNVLRYTPDPGFLGLDTVAIDYWVLNPYGSADPADLILTFEVVPSVVTAQNDFAITSENTAVTVDVLANDYTVGGASLQVASIALANNGQAVLNADSTLVTFSPDAGFSGLATFHYTICDDLGTCDVAVVNVRVDAANPPLSDTLKVFTVKNKAQVVLLDLSGYQLTQAPAHGTLQTQGNELYYEPATDFTGSDVFVYTKTDGQTQYTRTGIVQVFDAPAEQTFAFNDVAFTSPDTSIEIEVFRNDVGGATLEFVMGQSAQHGTVTYLGNGVFEYAPDSGFEGLDKFTYLAYPPGFSGAPEEATVYVAVSDFEPAASVFPLTTTKDKPLVVGYHIPVYNYSLALTAQPVSGTVTYYPGWQTINLGGQDVEGYNMLVYTPDPGFTGNDSFAFSYCLSGNGNCPVIQVDVEVKDLTVSPDQYCVDKHCVWAGDANWDGKVDMADLLPIGLCMGEVGVARTNPDLSDWYGQYGQDWGLTLGLMGFDAKNVDTDGDGLVGASDTAAIAAFYGNVHQPFAEPLPAIEGLQPYIVTLDSVISPGDVIEAQIWLGTPEYPVIDGYGLTFSLAYEPAIFEDVSIDFSAATQSWLGYNSPLLYMTHEPAPGKLDAGITRTSGQAVHGYGIIGTASFIVVDDLPGFKIGNKKSVQLPIRIEGGTLMLGNGLMGALPPVDTEVTLRWEDEAPKGLEMIDASKLKIYPNPATDIVDFHLNGVGNAFQRVQVYSITGQMLYDSGEVQARHWQLDVSDFTPGMYVVRAITTAGTISKKLQVGR